VSLRVAIFASGGGTNALNLLKVAEETAGLQVAVVVVDQVSSPLPEIVQKKFPNVPVAIVPAPKAKEVENWKAVHEAMILGVLQEHRVEWIFLAGYMRLIGETLLAAYSSGNASRIVNIHPSLLPAYPGLHSYERAFEANEAVGGVTIHLVDSGVDTGPVLVQQSFERLPGDTLAHFIDRGKKLEWQLYGEVLRTLAKQKNLQPAMMRNP
jgi:phosphoribosylglycinamide formyltransferase-1